MITYTSVSPLIPEWKVQADRFMECMFAERALPDDRAPLTGNEDAIFAIRSDHGAAGSRGTTIQPVGMAVCYQPEGWDGYWLDLLYVDPAYRRQGIGRELIEATVRKATTLGLPFVELGVLAKNQRMWTLAHAALFSDSVVYLKRIIAPAGKDRAGAE